MKTQPQQVSRRLRTRSILLAAAPLATALALSAPAHAQLNVISVDCTPFTSPGITSFGFSNTMGMSLQQVDPANTLFNVTEVTPPAFRALTAAQLATYDLIAINNHPARISDNCIPGSPGLGTTWHSVIGINSGSRIHLNSHDAARFKIIVPPNATPFSLACPGCEPFAADDLIRQAALWAGGGSQTGLMIFNDSARFPTVGGVGWNNPELNLPAAWGISDSDQFPGGLFTDGGYTRILPAFSGHPIYTGLTDVRLAPNSVSSFAANIVDDSFHSVFATYNAAIFTPTEQIVNAGVIDVGGLNAQFGIGTNLPAPGPDGLAVSLIRDEDQPPVAACVEGTNPSGKNTPKAGQKSKGQNEDGFYQLLAIDDNDPAPQIFVSDANGSGPFGPFSAGDTVKITEAPGGLAASKPMAGAVVAHVTLTADAIVTATDAAGNSASVACLVPPPPK